MNIYLYKFKKRRNSTGIPSGQGAEVSVALKAPTSDHRPVFILQHAGELDYNYIKWGPRWYWITDKVHRTNDVLEISAELDELATLRSDIFASSAFVLYDTAANVTLTDNRLSTQTAVTETSASGSFSQLGTQSPTDLATVVTVTGSNGVGSYYLPESSAKNLLTDVANWAENAMPVDPPTGEGDLDYVGRVLSSGFQQQISAGNAADNIRSAIILPLPASAFTGTTQRVYLGRYRSGIDGLLLSRITLVDSADVTIPWQFTDWRRNSPYTAIRLYIPWLGIISLPPSGLIDVSTLRVGASVDLRTGDAIFTVYAVRGTTASAIGRYNTNVGAAYPIGSSNLAPLAGVNAITSAAGGLVGAGVALYTGHAAGAAAAGAAGIAGITNALQPFDQCVSGMGSAAAFSISPTIICFCTCHDTNVAPASVSAVIGTPAMQVKQLGTLSGYVQTRAASVSSNALQQDIDAVNAALDGGVYIE